MLRLRLGLRLEWIGHHRAGWGIKLRALYFKVAGVANPLLCFKPADFSLVLAAPIAECVVASTAVMATH